MRFHGTMRVNEAGHLEIGGCDAVDLAERFGTPLYVMDEEAFTRRAREVTEAFQAAYPGEAHVVYAGKAFLTVGFARLVEAEGLFLDVASGGELYTARVAGFPPERLVVHGNNKSHEELEMALAAGAGRLVVDNLSEVERIARLVGGRGAATRLLLRVRPGIGVHTHDHMRTGQEDSKFGFSPDEAREAAARLRAVPGVELVGLHAHLGSQIAEPGPYELLGARMVEWLRDVAGVYGRPLTELDLGGGWAVPYTEQDPAPPVRLWAEAVSRGVLAAAGRLGMRAPRLLVEPGRLLASEAGTTLYRVGAVKEIPGTRTYAVTDGGLYESLRVALYGAAYEGILANRANEPVHPMPSGSGHPAARLPVRVVGKNCESGDILVDGLELPPIAPGDLLAVPVTGAYHYAMASNYNRLPRPAVVLVRDGAADLLVGRETYEDLVRHDRIPAWLAAPAAVAPGEGVSSPP
ncbi:diaminopimelate decarboxylase [Limnochorda pilosa]|uniref:Diaminopimelate decarboxylase n=1 Tax=Limnochorda pilosa TaxID=1555112 RepID=A0A0K2SKJ9_LIMPI|nr:diaminopimelate decarboxylase [Limnochorda pilosa]BAS27638.1 diaminopimelate decarboxylase [Limnochorda pilosa]